MTRGKGTLRFLAPPFRRQQRVFVTRFRRYVDRAPGWADLATRGRRTGLPRGVLPPCRRIEDDVMSCLLTGAAPIGYGTC